MLFGQTFVTSIPYSPIVFTVAIIIVIVIQYAAKVGWLLYYHKQDCGKIAALILSKFEKKI